MLTQWRKGYSRIAPEVDSPLFCLRDTQCVCKGVFLCTYCVAFSSRCLLYLYCGIVLLQLPFCQSAKFCFSLLFLVLLLLPFCWDCLGLFFLSPRVYRKQPIYVQFTGEVCMHSTLARPVSGYVVVVVCLAPLLQLDQSSISILRQVCIQSIIHLSFATFTQVVNSP